MIIEDFNIATDVKVEFLLPDEAGNTFILGISTLGGDDVLGGFGIFILGESLLGGTDVLGTSNAFLWQAAEAVVAQFDMNLGGSIDNNIFFQPEAASARLQLQSFDWDPNVNKNIRTNTAIRLRLDDGVANHTLFTGYIDTITVNYIPGGLNLISITAFDLYKQIVNTRIASYDTTDYPTYVTPLQAIERVLQDTGYSISDTSVDTEGKIPPVAETNIVANSVINEALQVGLGVLWVDPEAEALIFRPRPTTASGTATTWIIGNNHGDAYHLCLSDITVAADADTIFNSLKVALKSDEETYIALQDTDSIELYGESASDVVLNVTDTDELTRWATAVFSQTPNKLVKQVETPTIDRLGNLTEASLFQPGTLVGVDFEREQLHVQDFYTITKVSHEINVNGWYTTLELWKES